MNAAKLKRLLQGGRTTHPYIKTYLVSESTLYAALNLITPFFALFVIKDIPGGSLQVATLAMTAHFLARILVELTTGQRFGRLDELSQIRLIIIGMILVSLAYAGFALTFSFTGLFVFWIISGIGWGISLPVKMSLFSHKLQKDTEPSGAFGWAVNDSLNLSVISLATLFAGAFATAFGYRNLFFVASIINVIPVIMYATYYFKLSRSR